MPGPSLLGGKNVTPRLERARSIASIDEVLATPPFSIRLIVSAARPVISAKSLRPRFSAARAIRI